MSIDPRSYTYPDNVLQNRVILITGSSDGIGRALALHAAKLGAQVILHGRSVQKLEKIYDEIEAMEGTPRPSIAVMDLESANAESYTTLAQSIESEFGRLDGLLHNAAMLGALIPISHFQSELWYKILQVNLNAPFMMTRACLNLLLQSNDASILFSSDSVGRRGKAYWGAYGISKAASENFMQGLADEMEANTSVRVNSFDPGAVATAFRSLAYPGENPQKIARPEDVVAPYLYLMGPDSKGITGKQFCL